MAKKTTLNELGSMMEHVVKHMATKEDIADVRKEMATKGDIAAIRKEMATKDQVIALHTQANAIEGQLRNMKHVKLEGRVADLEESAFGKVRA